MKNNPIIWVVKNFYVGMNCLFLLGSGNILYGLSIIHQEGYAIQSPDYTALKDINNIAFPEYDKSFQSNFESKILDIFSLDQIKSLLNTDSFALFHVIIIILVSFVVIQFLYTRFLLIRPLKKIRQKLNQISQTEENYGDQIFGSFNGVLSDIAKSINTMSSSLQSYSTDMDKLVNQRVTKLNRAIDMLNQELKIYQSQNQLLNEIKAKFKMVVENPVVGIFQIDSSGRFSYTNDAFNKIFAFNHEELKYKEFTSLAPVQFQEDIKKIVKNFLSNDESKGEMILQSSNGKEIYIYYNVWKLKDNGFSYSACGFLEDISLRKLEYLKLQDRERLLYDFIKNLTTGVVYADTKSKKIQDINNTLLQMTGYTKNEILSLNTILDIMPEQYHVLINQKIDFVIKTGQNTEFVISFRTKKGTFFPADVSISLLKNEEGKYNYIVLLVHDITKHKQKEKKLINEKKRLANYLETIIDSIIVTDIKGNSILANQSYLNLIGYPRHNLTERNAMETLFPTDVPKLEEEFNSELFTKGYIKDKETNIKTKKGKTIPVLYSAKVLNDNSGQPVNLVGIIRDNRKRKKEQEILKKISAQAEFTAKLLLTSAQPFALFSEEGKCYNCKTAFCSMTGYSKTEILQITNIFNTLTHAEWQNKESEVIQCLIESGKPQRYEKECVRKDGTRIFIDSSLNLLPNNTNTKMYICSFMNDITKQKSRIEKIKEDLNRKNNLLKKLHSMLNPDSEL